MQTKTLKTNSAEMNYGTLVEAIAQALEQTQRQAAQAVNMALTLRNWRVGYYILSISKTVKTVRTTAKNCSKICRKI